MKNATKQSTMTKQRRLEIGLILKKVKDISDQEIAEFSGVTRQTLDNRIRKGQKV